MTTPLWLGLDLDAAIWVPAVGAPGGCFKVQLTMMVLVHRNPNPKV